MIEGPEVNEITPLIEDSPGAKWVEELRALHRLVKTAPNNSSAQILDELREDIV